MVVVYLVIGVIIGIVLYDKFVQREHQLLINYPRIIHLSINYIIK